MNASTRYLVDRMIKDAEFLGSQGHLGTNSVTAIRNQLAPLSASSDAGDATWETIDAGSASASAISTADKSTSSQTATTTTQQPKHTLGSRLAPWAKKVPPPPSAKTEEPQTEKEQQKQLVKALWAFDATGGDDELKFAVGDVIHVVEKNDESWWTGTLNGRRGLFPANYVEPYTLSEASSEPLSSLPTPQRNLPPAYNTAVASSSVDRVYAPVKARWTSGSSIPTSPPAEKAGSQVQTQQQGGGGATAAAPGPGPAGLQPADSEEEKKKQDKLKKLGGKVGTAAAGGFGFGIGAGLASNLF